MQRTLPPWVDCANLTRYELEVPDLEHPESFASDSSDSDGPEFDVDSDSDSGSDDAFWSSANARLVDIVDITGAQFHRLGFRV